ncbi:MAG: HipA N-terminal domain-containing protein [Candidatus Pseudobacter hemicellulosilyticus]|uniref:HipA N-terminal domain-containing protein n=1 Tax=Candidatus Pseudobacter hemicellulosilyticus TaxID=3121375 RepID=A0AAJ5WXH8_9BACT|nr:MAG: HipA N-terminal domain-containing protein [Pseudobacter sp.]
MRAAWIFYNGELAGVLSQSGDSYQFVYDKDYLVRPGSKPVSLTLPLQEEPYSSEILFPAFVNRLSEGANKAMQNRLLKIDENDYFGLLLATAVGDGIGPLTIEEIHESSGN